MSFGTSIDFEQYRNIFIRPGISFVSDDLTVDSTASNLLKKQAGTYNELSLDYAIRRDERNRAYMPTKGYVTSFYQSLPLASDTASIKNVPEPHNGSTKLLVPSHSVIRIKPAANVSLIGAIPTAGL